MYKIIENWKVLGYSDLEPILSDGQTMEIVERSEYEAWLEANQPKPEVFITITIPVSLIMGQPTIQQKIDMINRLYSDIHRRTENGTCELSNIALKFVKEFLTAQEYTQLKGLGIEFSPAEEVEVLFANPEADEEATV